MKRLCVTLLLGLLPALALTAPVAGLAPPAEPARSEGTGRPISSASTYVQLEPLITAVHYGSSVSGLLHIELSLDVPDARLRTRIRERQPRLRDAYISVMASYAGLAYRRGEVPDVARITQLLQRATDSVLGETGAEVLLSMVIIHER
jgi:flagellar basal body-associated protein FliL